LLSISSTGFAEQTINKSQFIAMAIPCLNEREVGMALRAFAQQHANAHHIAYAFRIKTAEGVIPRFSDAGEPSGTAGMPILKLIEGRDLINICVAVIRYYGGINLGTGGLARAYGGTAKMALDQATVTEFVQMAEIRLTIEYNQMDTLTRALSQCNGKLLDKQFAMQVDVLVLIPEQETETFINRFKSY
jgi:uncharacterized YigZ family protein